jgi:phospholipid/cholesterol/gamma-HCH transport system ATP-binding protein
VIRLEGVKKCLGGRTILDGLDLHVRRGETYVLLGPSGTGKSVTLKHIVGLLKPDEGTVIVDGEDMTSRSRRALDRVRLRIGYVFQSGALVNWLSVGDNVALPLREHGRVDEAEIQATVREKLDLVHLAGEEDKMPDALSGGMRKRVGIARALVLDPSILLFDEPTAGLDPVRSRSITRLIGDMERQLEVTSLIVTHDLEVAFDLADRVGFLHRGRIHVEGTPTEMQTSKDRILNAFLEGKNDEFPSPGP